jgi:hypothetical protein
VALTSAAASLFLALRLATGQPVVFVPGPLFNRMAGALADERTTDAKDARSIAEIIRMLGDLIVITSPDQIVSDLRVLTARRGT